MTNMDRTKHTPPMRIEKKKDVMDVVGGNGPWQIRIFCVLVVFSVPIASHNLVMSFFAPNLDHWCARPKGLNWTVEEWKSYGLPAHDTRCSRYDLENSAYSRENNFNSSAVAKIVSCDSWEYNNTLYGSTVLDKWNLVCEHEWWVSMSKSIFIGGYLFSVMLFGYLADKFGRKPIISICNIIALISATVCAFSSSFLMFAVCRFFIAVGVAGALNTAFILMMEVIGTKYRSSYGLSINFGWCFGFVSLPLVVWLVKDWVWVQLIITIPCVFLLSSWWLLPESPRWLITRGNEEAALRVLLEAGKANGVPLVDKSNELKQAISMPSKVRDSDQPFRSLLQLVWSSGIWKISLIVFYLWFVIAFVYYGLSFNTNELAGDPYVNFAVSGAMEIPAYALTLFVIRSMGRRIPQAVSLSAAGVACLFMYILPEEPWWISVVVYMIGKFCIASAFGILYVYTTEIFPTNIRNISLGSASMCGRFGSIIAPFVRELGNATHPVVPQLVFGVLAVIGGFLVLFLPETNNVTVPDTLEEAIAAQREEFVTQKTPCLEESNI